MRQEQENKAALGHIRRMDGLVITQRTDHIVAKLGVGFGVQFLFENVPADGVIEQQICLMPPQAASMSATAACPSLSTALATSCRPNSATS